MKIVPDLTSSQWAALSPVTSYILGTLFFTSLETFNIWEQHRVYPSKEELKRNKVSRAAVITHAVCYHSVTTALALVFVKALPPLTECSDCFGSYAYWRSSVAHYFPISNHDSTRLMVMSWLARLTYLGVRQFIAFFIFDTWLYWTHLFAHRNRWWFSKFTNYLFPVAHALICDLQSVSTRSITNSTTRSPSVPRITTPLRVYASILLLRSSHQASRV
jgi:sphinganine C4-monooxygenase